MKKVKLGIGYHTDELYNDPTHVILQFTPELIKKISYFQNFVKYNNIHSIVVTDGFVVSELLNNKVNSEFNIGISKLVIYSDYIIFWADNDWLSASQIESTPFTLNQLIKSRVK